MERIILPYKLCLFIIYFCLCVSQSSQYISVPECHLDFCNGTSSESSDRTTIEEFCTTAQGILKGRCCLQSNESIGLDLSNCSLHSLHNILSNLTALQFLDLSNNTFENCSNDEFLGLINLDYLYLPELCDCPGNTTAWNNSNQEECFQEMDPCNYLNVSCTDNGHCLHLGPGIAECVCLPHHYGYKCLREGSFPYSVFVTSMIVATAIPSSLLWYFVGRHAKRE